MALIKKGGKPKMNFQKMEKYSVNLSDLNKKREEREHLKSRVNIDKRELVIVKAKLEGLYYELDKYQNGTFLNEETIDDEKLLELMSQRTRIDNQLKDIQQRIDKTDVPADEISYYKQYPEKVRSLAESVHMISWVTFLPSLLVGGIFLVPNPPLAIGLWSLSAISLPIVIAANHFSKPIKTNCAKEKRKLMVNRKDINEKITERQARQKRNVRKISIEDNTIIEALLSEIKENKLQEQEISTRLEENKKNLLSCEIEIEILEDRCASLEHELRPVPSEEMDVKFVFKKKIDTK